jgi:hypothetical protein
MEVSVPRANEIVQPKARTQDRLPLAVVTFAGKTEASVTDQKLTSILAENCQADNPRLMFRIERTNFQARCGEALCVERAIQVLPVCAV